MHGNGPAVLGRVYGRLCRAHDTVSPECGDLNYPAAELAGQLPDINLIAVLADDVHHVYCNDHGDTQLSQLSGQVEVALEVGAVDNV